MGEFFPQVDIVPSHAGTLLEHDAYHRSVFGEDESLLAEIAEVIGAEQLGRRPNGDYDLRSTSFHSRSSASSWKAMGSVGA